MRREREVEEKLNTTEQSLHGTARKEEFAKANEFNNLMAGFFVWVWSERKKESQLRNNLQHNDISNGFMLISFRSRRRVVPEPGKTEANHEDEKAFK
jgi:hypothetical protein